ncbi:hypothetical protein MTR67_001501 [Solanum verrucosum]|uniref:Uncharacterized protein n=1 Tax=Solanum verrucosum TaxID=315347 RepID=A0AAF0PNU5_SOLVR|nr:hypothetical protein MTR67_001501 [Solanum verrucosum]
MPPKEEVPSLWGPTISHCNLKFEDYKESNRSGRTLISISGLFVWTLQVSMCFVVFFNSMETSWIYHGEELFSSKLVNQLDKGDDHEMQDMLHEAFGIPPTSFVDMDTSAEGFDRSNQDNMGFDKKTEEFFRLLKEAERKLYPGSKYSLLSFLVRLLHLKCLNGWSNKSFSMLLELLKDVLPEGETLPEVLL